MTRYGRKKCALFKLSSLAGLVVVAFVEEAEGDGACEGNNRDNRDNEKNDCWGGGGRFRIDFPGLGSVTADDDGELDDDGDNIRAQRWE